eukprot:TRINITY_DN33781_c0_g1_i1.p1 TRINITY_DN33781_c0_g1~~TRINITY_DN33781_c0_g1_i1.p1  ORF type:complete len:444 (+),score=79.31 TRINITY_DN33781_c0_g1_i1:102-1433(+)
MPGPLGKLRRHLFPTTRRGVKSKQELSRHFASSSPQGSGAEGDQEVPPRRQRRLAADPSHGAYYDDDYGFNPESDGTYGDVDGLLSQMSKEEMLIAMQARMGYMTASEQQREREQETAAMREICQCHSMYEMLQKMDALIKDDWLGGLDELPGNIYRVSAFGLLHKVHKACMLLGDCQPLEAFKVSAAVFGFLCVFIIQLVGPPIMFFNAYYGWLQDEDDHLRWENFEFGDLSEWSSNRRATKLVGLLFVVCFLLNGFFVQMDEKQSWLKIDHIWRVLNQQGGEMSGSCELFLYIGAFMNCWVIVWLSLDVYFVIGCAENVQDVLFDALGLTFLYNLDDISGDLGFVDGDDWPGLQLAWVHEHIGEAAANCPDLDDLQPSPVCRIWLDCTSVLVLLLGFFVTTIFFFTNFEIIMPDEDAQFQAKFLEMLASNASKAFIKAVEL